MTKRKSYIPGYFRFHIPDYCALPIGGDTYKNCPNGCLYCYERQANNQHLRYPLVTPIDHRTLFQSLSDDPVIRAFAVTRRLPLRIGNCSDPFPPLERKARSTTRLLSLLNRAGYKQVQFTTKRPDVVDDVLLEEMLKLDKCMVRVSFSTFDDAKAAVLE